jgi:hypothetical protein
LFDIHAAYKTIEILGQALRNVAGSTHRDVKVEIIEKIVNLSRRVIGGFLQSFQNAEMISLIAQRISDVHQEDGLKLAEQEWRNTTFSHINGLSKFVCYTMLTHTSHSVVSTLLSKTLRRMLDKPNATYLKLFKIACLLEIPGRFPDNEILSLFGELQKNRFARELLRGLVVRHMYLYHVPYDSRQSVCKKLDITLLPGVYDQTQKHLLK